MRVNFIPLLLLCRLTQILDYLPYWQFNQRTDFIKTLFYQGKYTMALEEDTAV